jgi:hypothetical protein
VAYSVGNARHRAERRDQERDSALVRLRAVDRVAAKGPTRWRMQSICNDFGTFYAPNISMDVDAALADGRIMTPPVR